MTGIALVTRKLNARRDRQRVEAYLAEKDVLTRQQADERAVFAQRQERQAADLKRQQRALAQIEKKELASVQQALRREHRQHLQQRYVHSPTFALILGPPGRPAAIDKAAKRYTSETRQALEADEKKAPKKRKPIDLTGEFTRAAGSDDDDDGGGGRGDSGGHKPKPPTKPGPGRSGRRTRRRRDKDFNRGM